MLDAYYVGKCSWGWNIVLWSYIEPIHCLHNGTPFPSSNYFDTPNPFNYAIPCMYLWQNWSWIPNLSTKFLSILLQCHYQWAALMLVSFIPKKIALVDKSCRVLPKMMFINCRTTIYELQVMFAIIMSNIHSYPIFVDGWSLFGWDLARLHKQHTLAACIQFVSLQQRWLDELLEPFSQL